MRHGMCHAFNNGMMVMQIVDALVYMLLGIIVLVSSATVVIGIDTHYINATEPMFSGFVSRGVLPNNPMATTAGVCRSWHGLGQFGLTCSTSR